MGIASITQSEINSAGHDRLAGPLSLLTVSPQFWPLRLAIEGHTDATGSAEFNQTLSQKRADAVRAYLVSQGLDTAKLSSQGMGMNNPVADNNTAEGRQKNRRVEIIVSGEVIGTQLGAHKI
ncbi:MAG TPA: OmpA family protein [Candidatus Sulfotelmatobacter sp.]|nr:OmpA family protein [Candidatus Sulfotelmatobacter sp.]